jgi:predicted metal-binding protein
MADHQSPNLYICVTCTGSAEEGARPGEEYDAAGEPRPGKLLYEAVKAVSTNGAADTPVTVRPVRCLGNCSQGCSAAMAGRGKWGYLLGGLGQVHASDLIAYGAAYADSQSGMVLRRNRPVSLHEAIKSRFPVPGDMPDTDGFVAQD